MAVYTAQSVQKFLSEEQGKRVLYLEQTDRLTPSARDWLNTEGVEIRPKESNKPEQMTHLRKGELVPKTHSAILFRGMLDQLQAECLLAASEAPLQIREKLKEILSVLRLIMRCHVLDEPWQERTICGLTMEELRAHSHDPETHYGQGHFLPEPTDSAALLQLNRLRTLVRRTELAACSGIPDRNDLIRVLNRLSSLLWIMMIERKKEAANGTGA